ncbi:MAG TPA: hypothetical protein VH309_03820, partial [Elusimicrobiota bacterium]|nr:hypothetical protein [Elusimicrobiota bacterium]
MPRPEVVAYLRENLPKFSVAALRRQLAEEGVPEKDFDDSLAEALRGPKTKGPSRKLKKPSSAAAKLLLVGGLALIVGVSVYAIARSAAPSPAAAPAEGAGADEGAFVGPQGWVVRLPKGYEADSMFKDDAKTDEVIHFSPRGTDPTNFIDQGLYGELGIVKLEVVPSQFPANMTGAGELAEAVARKEAERGEKYVMKKIQIGTLP